MIEVFKTTIQTPEQATDMLQKLHLSFPEIVLNFDLEDCDNILRAEGEHIDPLQIIRIVTKNNYTCEPLI